MARLTSCNESGLRAPETGEPICLVLSCNLVAKYGAVNTPPPPCDTDGPSMSQRSGLLIELHLAGHSLLDTGNGYPGGIGAANGYPRAD